MEEDPRGHQYLQVTQTQCSQAEKCLKKKKKSIPFVKHGEGTVMLNTFMFGAALPHLVQGALSLLRPQRRHPGTKNIARSREA